MALIVDVVEFVEGQVEHSNQVLGFHIVSALH